MMKLFMGIKEQKEWQIALHCHYNNIYSRKESQTVLNILNVFICKSVKNWKITNAIQDFYLHSEILYNGLEIIEQYV